MNVFVTGTDTNVGKTIISSWLAVNSGYGYFKPIQTGTNIDSDIVFKLSETVIYKEIYTFSAPLSPHIASKMENITIDINKIKPPSRDKTIIEGAGGLMVPINDQHYIIDIIKQLNIPVILVARSSLGTINHTLLSIETLKKRGIELLGIIISGKKNKDNKDAISYYGKTKILAELPFLSKINYKILKNIPFNQSLKKIFSI